jgi:glycosyltransferase involved in cell wall biosynthesis
LRFLFFKESFPWPRAKGHDVHSYYMMQALVQQGHEVSLLTFDKAMPEALAGLDLANCRSLVETEVKENGRYRPRFTPLQERFRSYWGIEPAHVHEVGQMACAIRADAVVVVGLSVLPYLGEVKGAIRIWYAADEWAWHHFSQVRLFDRSTWDNVKQALTKGLYERAYASVLDRVWVVSETDRRAMHWVAGPRAIDVIPNGVDGEHYVPRTQAEEDQSCVFWGRLDFGPNIQALSWFCRRIWPAVRKEAPGARFTIYGFNPTGPIKALAGRDGVQVIPDLPDLRPEIGRHQVVVLPFVSGGGIKNKLLEAASMGKAIVSTPKACGGLQAENGLPIARAGTIRQWVNALRVLWSSPEQRRRLGDKARAWVLKQHSWATAARTAVKGIQLSLGNTE